MSRIRTAGLPDGLTLEFRSTNLGMRLLRNDEVEAAIDRARQRQIVWPSQINFTLNADGRLPDVEDLFGSETRALLDPNSPGKTILNALRAGGEPSEAIGMDAGFSFFRSNTGDTYVAAVFELDAEAITWNGNAASLQVFYNVVDALGTVIGYDERAVEVPRGRGQRASHRRDADADGARCLFDLCRGPGPRDRPARHDRAGDRKPRLRKRPVHAVLAGSFLGRDPRRGFHPRAGAGAARRRIPLHAAGLRGL